jgi:hypothetical protein
MLRKLFLLLALSAAAYGWIVTRQPRHHVHWANSAASTSPSLAHTGYEYDVAVDGSKPLGLWLSTSLVVLGFDRGDGAAPAGLEAAGVVCLDDVLVAVNGVTLAGLGMSKVGKGWALPSLWKFRRWNPPWVVDRPLPPGPADALLSSEGRVCGAALVLCALHFRTPLRDSAVGCGPCGLLTVLSAAVVFACRSAPSLEHPPVATREPRPSCCDFTVHRSLNTAW